VLTDDKVGSGPRLRPGSLSQEPSHDEAQPMETEPTEQSTSSKSPRKTPSKTSKTPSLASKLAAQSVKRKATDPTSAVSNKQRLKH